MARKSSKKYKLSILVLLGVSLFVVSTVSAETVTLLDEGFEGEWSYDAPPSGWSTDTCFWMNSVYGDPHSGSQHAYSYMINNSMITPSLNFQDDTELSFWYTAEISEEIKDLEVYLDGTTLVWYEYDINGSLGWQQAVVDLSNYSGAHTIEFIDKAETGLYGLLIDDVSVTTNTEASQELIDVVTPFLLVLVVFGITVGLVETIRRF